MNGFVNLRRSCALAFVTALIVFVNSAPVRLRAAATLFISEVHPSGSGNGTYAADWFEVTNTGTTAVDITGWKVDDNSNAFASAVPLSGVTSIAPGQSVVFVEATRLPVNVNAFTTAWFGGAPPAGLAIGFYGGSGVGLSTSGDAVNLFDAGGNRMTGISLRRGDRQRHLRQHGRPRRHDPSRFRWCPTLSAAGVNGAFLSFNGAETGSPGRRLSATPLTGVDLSDYVRVGRFDLPEPTRTTAPPAACSRRKPRASPTTGTPTRCSSSATAARRSCR